MMKRIISVMLCAVCLLTAMSMMASARAEKVEFSLATTDGGVGDTVTVTMSLPADSYFTNTTFNLYYNPAVVQFSEERAGAVSPSSAMFMVLDYPTDGYVRGAYVAAKPIKKGGVLVEFDFVIMQETEMVFSVGFEECVGEDENGTMFDVNYVAGTCVLNKGKGVPATTAKPKETTRVTVTPTTAVNTTKAPDAPQATVTTLPVTYPTDANGITLAPHVVTEPNGNAATEPNGAVVTMVTTTTAAPSDAVDVTDPTTDPTDPMDTPPANNRVVVLMAVLAALAVASGLAAVVIVRKKKAAEKPEE